MTIALERGRAHPLGATPVDGGFNIAVFAAHATRKSLRPHVQTIYPLDQAAQAQDVSREGHVRGKLVLAL